MKRLLIFLLPVLCAAAGQSAIDGAIDLARAAPGEFAADAMIRIAALDSVGKARKTALLEEAFWRASEAQQPYMRYSALASAAEPSRFLNRVYAQGLDRTSLQLRAVDALLAVDPKKAVDLFRQMLPLELSPVGCDDFLVYDVDRFYEVLGRVASQAFIGKEREHDAGARFLAGYMASLASAVQVTPAARMLSQAGLTDQEFRIVLTAFSGALPHLAGDDRSFTFSASRAGPAILTLAQASARRETPPQVLLQAYREFLVRNLSGARCADHRKFESADEPGAGAVAFFNTRLRDEATSPIAAEETEPAKLEGEAKDAGWCQDPECQSVDKQYRDLLLGSDGRLRAPSSDPAVWQVQLQELLNALAGWRESSGISAARQFREKNGVFYNLLAFVPEGPSRDLVIGAELEFLTQSRLQAESRIEWFFPVDQLIARFGREAEAVIPEQLRRTSDPVIALYVALESIAPRSAADVVSMF